MINGTVISLVTGAR